VRLYGWQFAAQVKTHECGLGLLRQRLNVGPVCDERTNETLRMATLPLQLLPQWRVSSPCISPVSSLLNSTARRTHLDALDTSNVSCCVETWRSRALACSHRAARGPRLPFQWSPPTYSM